MVDENKKLSDSEKLITACREFKNITFIEQTEQQKYNFSHIEITFEMWKQYIEADIKGNDYV